LARANNISFFAFENLNWRLIEFKSIIIAISMYIGWNRGNRLVFIEINQMLNYFGFVIISQRVDFISV
jgi:hypothetical protein